MQILYFRGEPRKIHYRTPYMERGTKARPIPDFRFDWKLEILWMYWKVGLASSRNSFNVQATMDF